MSNVALFAAGAVVTLLVVASLALLTWGAILDGRYEDEQRAAADEARLSDAARPRPPARRRRVSPTSLAARLLAAVRRRALAHTSVRPHVQPRRRVA